MSTLYDMRSGTLVKGKLFTNGLSLKDVINTTVATPSITSVSDYLLNGGGESAIDYAMAELADGATDWVLDPANNAVKYKDSAAAGGTGGTGSYSCSAVATSGGVPAYIKSNGWTGYKCSPMTYHPSRNESSTVITATGGRSDYKLGTYYAKGNFQDSPSGDEYKYIPIETLAQQVIANAEAGHAPSQEAVNNSVKI